MKHWAEVAARKNQSRNKNFKNEFYYNTLVHRTYTHTHTSTFIRD